MTEQGNTHPTTSPERLKLAIERVSAVINEVDYDCGHFVTGDNLKIMDVFILLDAARQPQSPSTEVSDAMITAGRAFLHCALGGSYIEGEDLVSDDDLTSIYLAMKAQEASNQSPADEVEIRQVLAWVDAQRRMKPQRAVPLNAIEKLALSSIRNGK